MIATLFKFFFLYLAYLAIRSVIRIGIVAWQVKKGLDQQKKSYAHSSTASSPGSSTRANKSKHADVIEAEFEVIN